MSNNEAELSRRLTALEARLDELTAPAAAAPERVSMVVFSGELDRQLAAFVIATGAAASGMAVTMFFTFWATSALRRRDFRGRKDLLGRAFGWMLPRGSRRLPLSRLNFAGVGPELMRYVMHQKGTASLEELMTVAGELGVEFRACEMSMGLLGIDRAELVDLPGMESCGVATFVERAASSRFTLFI